MTGTEPAAVEPELTSAEYHAQWRELEGQFPPPAFDDVKAEWLWLREQMEAGTLDPDGRYGGLAIAVYNRRVVGTDPNWLRLRVRLSRELGVHPERIVMTSLPL